MIDAVLWIVVGFGAVTAASHLSEAAWLAALQALTPWAMGPSLPAGIVALATGRWWVAGVGAVVTVTLATLARPLLRPRRRHHVEGPHLRVLYANVKFDQPTPERAAATVAHWARHFDVDVVAASEVTVRFADALAAADGARRFPHRVGTPVVGPEASVIWSRLPALAVGDAGPGPTWDAEVTVEVDGTPVRIIATHPLPPVGRDMRPHWKPGLRSTADRARRPGPPTLVVGDLNAARWHRPWRRFVGDDFVSAHEVVGRGWSTSWPDEGRLPRFVRLDHALCGPGLRPVRVDDVPIDGSDHRGFVVTLAAKARTA